MTAGEAPYSVSEKTLSDLAQKPSTLAASTLHMANVLQSSLELPKLMEMFEREVKQVVPHDGMEYANAEERTQITFGHEARHSCSYDLVVMDKWLGQITFRREQRFSKNETDELEALICALVYPLRNALLYKRALETALKDPVTGINNRAALNATIDREVNLAHRHGNALSVIMLDIDHFKRINDSYGHLAGDVVLCALAKRVMERTRGSDMVFRYGGEEFTVVLSNTDVAGATLLANRIRKSVERLEIVHEDMEIQITVSLGVATLEHGDSATTLLNRADEALYEAKTTGRNRVVTHSTGDAAA